MTILVQCSSKVQEITDAFLDFAADPSVSMTFHVEREKLERLLDTAHVVARDAIQCCREISRLMFEFTIHIVILVTSLWVSIYTMTLVDWH